jgi:hypothetical protein
MLEAVTPLGINRLGWLLVELCLTSALVFVCPCTYHSYTIIESFDLTAKNKFHSLFGMEKKVSRQE